MLRERGPPSGTQSCFACDGIVELRGVGVHCVTGGRLSSLLMRGLLGTGGAANQTGRLANSWSSWRAATWQTGRRPAGLDSGMLTWSLKDDAHAAARVGRDDEGERSTERQGDVLRRTDGWHARAAYKWEQCLGH